jgi:hypothetical protein
MADATASNAVESLGTLVGKWTMEVSFPGAPPAGGATLEFEWLAGERFLIQRWEVPVPEAPDGIAIIGYDPLRGTLLQHYFDSRGIARIYEMSLGNGVWKLERRKEDFSPLDFSQRYTGRFKDDGKVIEGTWEISHDHSSWEKDFDLTYTRVG